ncbi:MAG: spore coat protein CotJB [Ruminococcus sp.]|nr:spore coat protein CotJB [Ruminococcus sp.]
MLFEDNDFDINVSLFMPDVNLNRNEFLFEPMEGFLRGNMFKNEYLPYKNLTYFKLDPINEKENDLYKVMALSFAINDLNLYLDLHPDNKEVFTLFKKYIEEKEKLCKEYEKKYGPLELTNTIGSKYNWLNSPWPWDNLGGSLYV